jgi:hypothetical protein
VRNLRYRLALGQEAQYFQLALGQRLDQGLMDGSSRLRRLRIWKGAEQAIDEIEDWNG